VYELINGIVARAAGDPRKFSGFEKHWAPQASALLLPTAPEFMRRANRYVKWLGQPAPRIV